MLRHATHELSEYNAAHPSHALSSTISEHLSNSTVIVFTYHGSDYCAQKKNPYEGPIDPTIALKLDFLSGKSVIITGGTTVMLSASSWSTFIDND